MERSADKHREPTLRFCSQTETYVCNVDNSTGSVPCKVFHKWNEETIHSPVSDQHCQRWTSRLSTLRIFTAYFCKTWARRKKRIRWLLILNFRGVQLLTLILPLSCGCRRCFWLLEVMLLPLSGSKCQGWWLSVYIFCHVLECDHRRGFDW
jgi:hypothetical protein